MIPRVVFEEATEFETYKEGRFIFREGDRGDRAYVVLDGEIELRAGDRAVGTLFAGEIFGEIALVDDSPRSASAVAKTECTLVPIDQALFLSLIQKAPYFAIGVMKMMAERLREMNARV